VDRWITEFLEYLGTQRRAAPATLRAYRDDLNRFAVFARSRLRAEPGPENFTPELLAAFAASRSLQKATGTNRPISARTLGRSLAALRSFLRYLERRGKTTGALRGSLPRVSAPQPLPAAIGELLLQELMDRAAASVQFPVPLRVVFQAAEVRQHLGPAPLIVPQRRPLRFPLQS